MLKHTMILFTAVAHDEDLKFKMDLWTCPSANFLIISCVCADGSRILEAGEPRRCDDQSRSAKSLRHQSGFMQCITAVERMVMHVHSWYAIIICRRTCLTRWYKYFSNCHLIMADAWCYRINGILSGSWSCGAVCSVYPWWIVQQSPATVFRQERIQFYDLKFLHH